MNDIQRLEVLTEDIKNQIDELESFIQRSDKYLLKAKMSVAIKELEDIRSNLESYNDGIYRVFEDLNAEDNSEELKKENEVMREYLQHYLSWEDKTDLRIKHNIEIF